MKNVLLIFVLIAAKIFSQGEIISKTDADILFGQVLISKEIPTGELQKFTLRTSDKIMFNFINNELYILDNKRNVLLPIGGIVLASEVFKVYSVSVVQQLINQGNNPFSYIEKRQNVVTITNGAYTLEYAGDCPPFCTY